MTTSRSARPSRSSWPARARVERYQLRLLGTRDPLTHQLNRRGFVQQFEARLEEANLKAQPLAVGLLDLDRFKQINDVYGHLAGDQVVARLGSLPERRVRTYDLAGRWGGEEFIVAFYAESGATAEVVLGEYLSTFSTIPFESAADEILFASFSGGVATASVDDDDLASLIRGSRSVVLGRPAGIPTVDDQAQVMTHPRPTAALRNPARKANPDAKVRARPRLRSWEPVRTPRALEATTRSPVREIHVQTSR